MPRALLRALLLGAAAVVVGLVIQSGVASASQSERAAVSPEPPPTIPQSAHDGPAFDVASTVERAVGRLLGAVVPVVDGPNVASPADPSPAPADPPEANRTTEPSSRLPDPGDERTVDGWDTATGTERHRFTHDEWVSAVTWSPDGAWSGTADYGGTARLRPSALGP